MKIVVLFGDGIGLEIVNEVVKVLNVFDEMFEFEQVLVGGVGYEVSGYLLFDVMLVFVKQVDVILFGVVGDWKYDLLECVLCFEQVIFGLCKYFELFVNFCLVICYLQFVDVLLLKLEFVVGFDILIVCELNGDIYFGQLCGVCVVLDGLFVGVCEGFDMMCYLELEVCCIVYVVFQVV